jgi:hypothetical protein
LPRPIANINNAIEEIYLLVRLCLFVDNQINCKIEGKQLLKFSNNFCEIVVFNNTVIYSAVRKTETIILIIKPHECGSEGAETHE